VTATSFPEIIIAGGPFERGRQHGQQAGELIARHLALLTEALGQPRQVGVGATLRRDDLSRLAERFLPAYEAYAPDLVEELRGVAAGARISFAEALLLNVRGEVLGLRDEGCTAFAVGRGLTAACGVIAGQNSDQAAWNEEVMVVLKIRPDTGPPAVICTHAGLIGYHGCNAAGVGQFANAVPDAGRRPGGMPHYLMKRRLLAQTSVAGCLDVLRGARFASPANYVLADRDGALLDVEVTPTGLATLDAEDDLIVHTNHYVHPTFRSHNDAMVTLTGSACRATRLAELVRAAAGRLAISRSCRYGWRSEPFGSRLA